MISIRNCERVSSFASNQDTRSIQGELGEKAVVCLSGPTASGKTEVAIELAKRFPVAIISVDSGMIYRGMDIGTAKPTVAEQAIAPHYLIDICDPSESYSAAQFRADAILAIENIYQQGKIPLLVGGTMLYFKVLQQGISPLPSANPDVRAELNLIVKEQGLQGLYAKLQQIDPQSAKRISPQDSQRIQRALEVYMLTGKPINELWLNNPPVAAPYNFINIALVPGQRSLLHDRIERRIRRMIEKGFVAEVESLLRRGDLDVDLPSMRAVGYRQMWQYVSGKIDYNTMYDQILFATRQLAKRQLVWLRKWPGLVNVDAFTEPMKVIEKVFEPKKSS